MEEISPEFIERYQLLLEREPKSKVFAPLAEAYRKMGLAHKAYILCKAGLNYHPNFAGGHIAMARALMELEETDQAIQHLEKATELSPENILAYQILADLLLSLKKTKEALKAYKMVLFLSPDNNKAQKAVKKLESLSAEDFLESVFEELSPTSLSKKATNSVEKENFTVPPPSHDAKQNRLERFLSLIDAYIVRNDTDKALVVWEEARIEFAVHPELQKRFRILRPQSVSSEIAEDLTPLPSQELQYQDKRVQLLRNMLFNIHKYRKDKIPY